MDPLAGLRCTVLQGCCDPNSTSPHLNAHKRGDQPPLQGNAMVGDILFFAHANIHDADMHGMLLE